MKEETRRARRDRLIAAGELMDAPIQWDRQTSGMDVCPCCNGMDIWYIKQRDRYCPECDTSFAPA